MNEKNSKKLEERDKADGCYKVSPLRSIGTTLIFITSVIVVISMGLITALVSYFISSDTQINAEENNFSINIRAASECESRINDVINDGGFLYELYCSDTEDEEQLAKDVKLVFDRCRNIAGIAFVEKGLCFTSEEFFSRKECDSELFKSYVDQEKDNCSKALNGTVSIQNPSPFFQIPLLAVFTPVFAGDENDGAVILFSSDEIGNSMATSSINSSVLLNDEGIVLVHPDAALMMDASDLSRRTLVKHMIASSQSNRQLLYTDIDGNEYYGAYNKLKGLNAGVITNVETAVVLGAVRSTTRRNIYLTVAVLAIVILLFRLFARSISKPLELLTEITRHISQGNFNTKLFDYIKLDRNDEVGVLNRSTKDEQEILNTVTALTNKGVTKAIVQKKIDFKPHLKDITIFFSDIRSFTAISDDFNRCYGEKSAAEIIRFLNDYMSRMIACITATGGNVDKFEGDAIMACWGVLRDDELSFEQMQNGTEKTHLEAVHKAHVIHDMISAIRSSIGMRYALMKYNKDAEEFSQQHKNDEIAQYKPHIRIGCGLNCGRATVGFMGSNEKMEFTSIGDAVNLASRTESSNKPCGTDILITQDMYEMLKNDYIRCEENGFKISQEHIADEITVEKIPVSFEVKGKGKQYFYAVINMPQFDIEDFFGRNEEGFVIDKDCAKACGPMGPKTLNDVRQLLGIPAPDFSEVNLDEQENKIKIS